MFILINAKCKVFSLPVIPLRGDFDVRDGPGRFWKIWFKDFSKHLIERKFDDVITR